MIEQLQLVIVSEEGMTVKDKTLDALNKEVPELLKTLSECYWEDALNKMGSATNDAVNKLDKAGKKRSLKVPTHYRLVLRTS